MKIWLAVSAFLFVIAVCAAQENAPRQLEAAGLQVQGSQRDGSFTIKEKNGPVELKAGCAANIDGRWIHSSDYSAHEISSPGSAKSDELTIRNHGLAGAPELICSLRVNAEHSYLEIAASVRNTTGHELAVKGLRMIEIRNGEQLTLGGPETADRILPDSFSEDRPAVAIHDFGDDTSGLYRGVGSMLIYNRESKQTLFIGALSSERWLTVLRLHADAAKKIQSYEVESTGTTELELENSLRSSPPEDRIELSLPVAAGKSIESEKVLVAMGPDYHAQLESYGRIIRDLHHARVSSPTLIGWWSWTAYYFGLNQGLALTNARWLAQNLKDLGYNYFHIDEGYQYARGEYTTPNKTNFPDGLEKFESRVQHLGLTPGIWTAPFEVSERSWVYQNHKDWLIQNKNGQPIHAGFVIGAKKQDQLYMLDSTNPGAQNYLRQTYSTLAHDWGIRYIKLDFMDDSAIEGRYFRPNTTAMEAQRIGLRVIREAVGEDVLLDKDGSAMLNPVGIVDTGRISQDTGHTFGSSHDAATGVAARYYMHRNFYVGDPDAFSVSRQTLDEQKWHGGTRPLTIEEARVSIALSAVSGGMFEIGDDLPILFEDADRMALVRNRDLLNMAKLGEASKPIDLMSYAPDDELPSIFLLHESKRQSILTVFNWTEKPREHRFDLSELGLPSTGNPVDVLETGIAVQHNEGSISFSLAPHSVLMLKFLNDSVPASAPKAVANVPDNVPIGLSQEFSAHTEAESEPAVEFRWDFGDGTSATGKTVHHTFTHRGAFTVKLVADGIDGLRFEKEFPVSASGNFSTTFDPKRIERLTLPQR
jgi:hypothetical protein